MAEYLTVQDVAIELKTSIKWVYCNKTIIPGFFKIGGQIRFDSDIFRTCLKKLAFKPN
ncbi:MAG: hypothetical protein NT007_00035 [Candidatus Kapabacteria bacterium]|nr:hypothetical protein [Candidatus Kapabacteria bacterium]